MTFIVAEECVRLGLRAGAIVFRGVRVSPGRPEKLHSAIAQQVKAVRERYLDPAAIRSNPEVVHFQELLRQVGVNPRREQPSVERLLNSALKRGDLPAINSLVDAYNLVSLRGCCSLGAHDLDKIATPVTLCLLTGEETFTPLGSATPVAVKPEEFGYVDGSNRVLCRLDLLQADFSKVTTATANVLLIVEGTSGHAAEAIRQAFADAVQWVTECCGGTAEVVAMP
jgi:DNA/RNA-binding domain of Phe-tRNA-synthetase-like protein